MFKIVPFNVPPGRRNVAGDFHRPYEVLHFTVQRSTCNQAGGEEMDLPKRKANRLGAFDYSSPGYYFITVCARGKENLFWESGGLQNGRPVLTPAGNAVLQCILAIPAHYPSVRLDQFNIMPNHVHLILEILHPGCVEIEVPVRGMKAAASRQAGYPLWQKGFYDHVIRTEADYQRIWSYVVNNHWKWQEDCYHDPNFR